MRKSLKRILAILVMAAVLLSQGAVAFADAPYRSYVQTRWQVDAASPDSYLATGWFNAVTAGLDQSFLEPDDMQITDDGDIYILDTKNNRIVIINNKNAEEEYRAVKVIDQFYWASAETYMEPPAVIATPAPEEGDAAEGEGEGEGDATEAAEQPETAEEAPADEAPADEAPAEVDPRIYTPLNEAKGLFVKGEYIYIADSGNNRVIKINHDGEISMAFYRPLDKAYTSDTYKPKKVVVDNSDMVYVISETVFQGAVLFNPDGTFNCFFGSANVEVTLKLLNDRFWKKIMSKEQKDAKARYVPIEYDNFDIDDAGFIYTCTDFSNTNLEQIRKLNPLGKNIYPLGATINFGDIQSIFYKQTSKVTKFVEVCVDEDDFIYAVDQERRRIYIFDQEGNTLMTFGTGSGAQFGTLEKPTGIDTYDGKVFVLDAMQGRVTIFEPTEYGETIIEAVKLFNDGLYQDALAPWSKVLALNCNYELAYVGMGEAMLKSEKYAEAVDYFRKGYAYEKESDAFEKLRDEVVRQNFGWIIVIVLIVMIALLVFTSKGFNAKLQEMKQRRKKG